jgi:hypothetical protein
MRWRRMPGRRVNIHSVYRGKNLYTFPCGTFLLSRMLRAVSIDFRKPSLNRFIEKRPITVFRACRPILAAKSLSSNNIPAYLRSSSGSSLRKPLMPCSTGYLWCRCRSPASPDNTPSGDSVQELSFIVLNLCREDLAARFTDYVTATCIRIDR